MTGRGASGFTLIELVVVLAIVGVVASVVTPALRRIGTPEPRDAAEALAAALARTSGLAARRAAPATLQLELASGSYTIVGRGAGGGADTTIGGIVRLDDGRLAGGRDGWATVTFDAIGRASGDAVVIEQGHQRWAVVADPWTGQVDVRQR